MGKKKNKSGNNEKIPNNELGKDMKDLNEKVNDLSNIKAEDDKSVEIKIEDKENENVNSVDIESESSKDESSKEESSKDEKKSDVFNEVVDEMKASKDNEANETSGDSNEDKDSAETNKEDLKSEDNKIEDKKERLSEKDDKIVDNTLEPYVDPSIYYYKKKRKRLKIVFGVILGVLLCAYAGGVVFHTLRFGTNTYLNDINISGKSISEVEEIFTEEMNKYTLEIDFKNGSETLKKGDGGIDFEFKKSIKEIKEQQNAFLWFVDLFTEDHFTLEYSVVYDKQQLSDYVLAFDYFLPFNMQPSINAKVEMVNGEVVVTPEKLGTKMDTDLVMDAVCGALDSYQTKVDLVNERCYIPAEITEDSDIIVNTKKNAETYLAIKAQLDFGNYVYQIPREDLSDMAYLDENGQVVISKRNVEIYARKLDEKFTTIDKMREFVTHDNRKILIWGDGYYGWEIDPVQEAEDLYEYMKRKKDFKKEISCITRGYAMSDMNDIGESYVEVDLEDQHVYLYINGRLILDSDCVSGRPSMLTPGGLYGLTYKAYDATLKGEDYETKVSFWMPFNWDIGLHDAIWRADFGGDIYTYDGSHGCVNLPYDVANTIFDYIDGGFPIVCYWDSEVTVVDENVDNDEEIE